MLRCNKIKLFLVTKYPITMAIDKVLQKIHGEIKDLTATLELFLDETIQPSVEDCSDLQKQLVLLQENIAIYKYNKLNKEISPSFNIHTKISQQEELIKNILPIPEVTVEMPPQSPEVQEKKEENHPPSSHKNTPHLSINLNDKFRFINELFEQNNSEYHIALEQLNNLKSWSDTELYLNSLKNLYEWQDTSEVVKYFYKLVKKRFD
jgi:hypothetical protein